ARQPAGVLTEKGSDSTRPFEISERSDTCPVRLRIINPLYHSQPHSRHEGRYPARGFSGPPTKRYTPAREVSMRIALALLVLPAFFSAAHAAEVKGTTRIDAVTVFPSGAEITRVGKVKLERGDHVILFTDLPARAIHSSIRVEGKAA